MSPIKIVVCRCLLRATKYGFLVGKTLQSLNDFTSFIIQCLESSLSILVAIIIIQVRLPTFLHDFLLSLLAYTLQPYMQST